MDFQFDVFLSHSSKDKAAVRPLAERLRHDGLKVWFDEWVLKPGDSIPAKIEEGLEHSRVLVLCISANAFGSDWAQLESGTFRFRDPLNKERRFIPLRLDDAPIKGSLAQFLHIDWRPADRELEYAKLLENCRDPTKANAVHRDAHKQPTGEIAADTASIAQPDTVADWTFQDLPDHQTRAYHHQLCEQYTDLNSFDLLELCGKWRRLAERFTKDAYASGRHGAYVIHDSSVDAITRLLETACAARGMTRIDRLGRCLRRPDNGHLHYARALLDHLEARLRAEAIAKGIAGVPGEVESLSVAPSPATSSPIGDAWGGLRGVLQQAYSTSIIKGILGKSGLPISKIEYTGTHKGPVLDEADKLVSSMDDHARDRFAIGCIQEVVAFEQAKAANLSRRGIKADDRTLQDLEQVLTRFGHDLGEFKPKPR